MKLNPAGSYTWFSVCEGKLLDYEVGHLEAFRDVFDRQLKVGTVSFCDVCQSVVGVVSCAFGYKLVGPSATLTSNNE